MANFTQLCATLVEIFSNTHYTQWTQKIQFLKLRQENILYKSAGELHKNSSRSVAGIRFKNFTTSRS